MRLAAGVIAALTASLFACSSEQRSELLTSPSPSDLCINLEGEQLKVPSGVQINELGCDLCVDVEGMQTAVPDGYTRNPETWTCTAKQQLPPLPKPITTVEFSGAGDIYDSNSNASESTGQLLLPGGLVFTLGDHAYPDGSDSDFAGYDRTSWGANKWRTRPTPGNHEYHTKDAAGYFKYFGAAAHAPDGYYAFMHDDWLIIALNTNPQANLSAELTWLESVLAAFNGACALAYGHHPWRSSGPNRDIGHMEAFASTLKRYHAEMLLSGHNHHYERFEPSEGLVQIVAGTGGHRLLYGFPFVQPGSLVREQKYGVVRLLLSTGKYEGEFGGLGGRLDRFHDVCR